MANLSLDKRGTCLSPENAKMDNSLFIFLYFLTLGKYNSEGVQKFLLFCSYHRYQCCGDNANAGADGG